MRKHIKKPTKANTSDNKGHQNFNKAKALGIFLHVFVILTAFFFTSSFTMAQEYQPMVEKNLFSPERRYEPYLFEQKKDIKKDVLKRFIILRGTLIKDKKRFAVIEVLPQAKRQLGIEENKRRFVVAEGDSLGECQVAKVRPEEVILSGQCEGVVLSFKDSPERKKELKPAGPPPKVQHPKKAEKIPFLKHDSPKKGFAPKKPSVK